MINNLSKTIKLSRNHQPFIFPLRSFHNPSISTLPPDMMQHTLFPLNLYAFFITAATTVADEG